METKTILAFAVAAMMMFAGGFTLFVGTDESDAAAGAAGNFNVYIYTEENDVGTWTKHYVPAYNAVSAVVACPEYSETTATIDLTYDYAYQYGGETYYDINPAYGTITKFLGLENDSVSGTSWNMLVLTKTGNESAFSWKLGEAATGWYKPFEDYAAYIPAYGTANIALYYGDANDSSSMATDLSAFISDNSSNDTISMTPVIKTAGSVFEHRFFIKKILDWGPATISSGTWVKLWNYLQVPLLKELLPLTGYRIVGYGSDAMLALIDAVGGSNVEFQETNNPYPGYLTYSWMISMLGLETYYDENSDEYIYWQIYTEHSSLSDSNNVSAQLVTGAYSALTNAPKTDGSLAFLFQAYTP